MRLPVANCAEAARIVICPNAFHVDDALAKRKPITFRTPRLLIDTLDETCVVRLEIKTVTDDETVSDPAAFMLTAAKLNDPTGRPIKLPLEPKMTEPLLPMFQVEIPPTAPEIEITTPDTATTGGPSMVEPETTLMFIAARR